MIKFSEWIAAGAAFPQLITALAHSAITITIGLWVAQWIYKIIIEIGNGGDR